MKSLHDVRVLCERFRVEKVRSLLSKNGVFVQMYRK